MIRFLVLNLFISLHAVFCRDFYVGRFRGNDFLVAQDNLYREKRPHKFVFAEYGRVFKCPITYFRVVDRLGVGSGPTVKVIRGGLRQKYIAVRIKSGYSRPVSVNIYVGCENPHPRIASRPWKATTTEAGPKASENATVGEEGGTGATAATGGDASGATGVAPGGAADAPGGEPEPDGAATPGGEPEPETDAPIEALVAEYDKYDSDEKIEENPEEEEEHPEVEELPEEEALLEEKKSEEENQEEKKKHQRRKKSTAAVNDGM